MAEYIPDMLASRATFELHEAVRLILGLETWPTLNDVDTLKEIEAMEHTLLNEIDYDLREPKGLVETIQGPRPIFRRKVLVDWCKKNGFKPLSLFPLGSQSTKPKPESAFAKERESLLKLLVTIQLRLRRTKTSDIPQKTLDRVLGRISHFSA